LTTNLSFIGVYEGLIASPTNDLEGPL
jgi:hypothetical protein